MSKLEFDKRVRDDIEKALIAGGIDQMGGQDLLDEKKYSFPRFLREHFAEIALGVVVVASIGSREGYLKTAVLTAVAMCISRQVISRVWSALGKPIVFEGR